MVTVYGIKNCDTVKKALKWLADHNIDARLHDYRQDGIDEVLLSQFVTSFAWQDLLNKRSTTWRELAQESKDNINEDNIVALLLAKPTLIKRPIILDAVQPLLGFSEKQYLSVFQGE